MADITALPCPDCDGGFIRRRVCGHPANCPCGDAEMPCKSCGGSNQARCVFTACTSPAVTIDRDGDLVCVIHGHRSVCSWCRKVLREGAEMFPLTSHTICKDCEADVGESAGKDLADVLHGSTLPHTAA